MGGIVSLFCALVFVPRLGIYGALIALAASTVAGVSYFSVALFWRERIHPFTWPYAKTLAVAATSMALVFRVIPEAGNDLVRILSVAAAFAIAFAISLFLVGAFTEKESVWPCGSANGWNVVRCGHPRFETRNRRGSGLASAAATAPQFGARLSIGGPVKPKPRVSIFRDFAEEDAPAWMYTPMG